MVVRVRRRAACATATAAAAIEPAPRVEARATLLREAPALIRRRLDLGDEQVVLRPLDGNFLADELLDGLEVQHARLVHEADGAAGGARPRRAPDAVHVVFRILGQVPVDHVADRFDVQPARGDVGGHEHGQGALLEIVDDPEPPLLIHVPGERARVPAVTDQAVLQPPRLLARVGEDQESVPLTTHEPQQQRKLLLAADVIERLLDALGRLLLRHDRDL